MRYTHLIDYNHPDETNGESDTYHLKPLQIPEEEYEEHEIRKNDENYDDATTTTTKKHHYPSHHNWCQPNPKTNGKRGHIVLFIPGHEGQYKQARSLAAHGITLSRQSENMPSNHARYIRQKLINGTMSMHSSISSSSSSSSSSINDINNFM